MKKVKRRECLKPFVKKYKRFLRKSAATAYCMVLHRELEKTLGRKFTKKENNIRERFADIEKQVLPDLVDWVKEYGCDTAFDTYELILFAKYDQDWRGKQYKRNIPNSSSLLKIYNLERAEISKKLKPIKFNPLKIMVLKELYPDVAEKEEMEDLVVQHQSFSGITLAILASKFNCSPLTLRNKLTEARKGK